MISKDEGDIIFRRPPGRGAVLTDSESELDGEISRNSSRSVSRFADPTLSNPLQKALSLASATVATPKTQCSRVVLK